MVQAILKQNGKVVPQRTCYRLNISEMNSDAEKKKKDNFDNDIKYKLGDSVTVVKPPQPTFGIEEFTS